MAENGGSNSRNGNGREWKTTIALGLATLALAFVLPGIVRYVQLEERVSQHVLIPSHAGSYVQLDEIRKTQRELENRLSAIDVQLARQEVILENLAHKLDVPVPMKHYE